MARRRFMTVDGIEELINMFEDMEEETIKILDDASNEVSKLVLSNANKYVPVKTGALKRSLDTKKVASKKETSSFYLVYSKGKRQGGVRYSFAVEAGTTDTKAQPFLRPAVDKHWKKITKTFNEIIIEGVDKATNSN